MLSKMVRIGHILVCFSACANFFSGEILNFPFVSIALTVGVAGSLKVSVESS